MIQQKTIHLPSYRRGFHLVTDNILDQLGDLPVCGMVNLLLQHTSAALTINENADPDVRHDFEAFINKLIPENHPVYQHTLEGSDDMPAHIKSSLFGVSITLPISNHSLNLGTWQGIYLCEFRNHGGQRKIIATIIS
ncbi:MAG TPA: secondary thiamine-phosphate synthase enzyme YjbQ [Prolixibacteraceae bacterium]|nr:YjbQ family protein [Bacteroidales bacterium]HPB04986.1 secondary thiamine-phosphate synthase enzyme YjbQ [Prolixibacteraceae bacterium]HUM88766.1 secondary thiamine-phosphate synthase enzyme YjbQ [Prolixibacteraceae bacterium]